MPMCFGIVYSGAQLIMIKTYYISLYIGQTLMSDILLNTPMIQWTIQSKLLASAKDPSELFTIIMTNLSAWQNEFGSFTLLETEQS